MNTLTATAAATRTWSAYQDAIFAHIADPFAGNAVIEAVAGSGKSTTIVHGMSLVPESQSTVFLAFNKAIADELKGRGVNAKTFHSLTYGAVTKFKNTRTVEPDKLRLLVKQNLSGDDQFLYGTFISKLVGLGRQVGIGCLLPDVESEWLDIVTLHDLELDNEGADLGRALALASDLLAWSNASPMVDFDDLLYLAVKEGLPLPKYFFVFVDEAQDTNAIQRAILRKIMGPKSRLIAVGDPAQAVYGFRGADSNSLNMIADEFRCKRLPLTVSYRCPTSVVEYAQQWVDHIEAAPNAPAGQVLHKGAQWKLTEFGETDLIVCRTTKPLIALAYRFLRARIPAKIMGKEIGQGLKTLVSKMKADGIDRLIAKLDIWCERESEKAIAKQQEAKAEAIRDKVDAIMCLVGALDENSRTIPEMLRVIDSLFNDNRNAVTLATIHKSKGLEADTVWWLNRAACPAKWARQAWRQQQELNLCYVATTRAKKVLVTFEEKEAA